MRLTSRRNSGIAKRVKTLLFDGVAGLLAAACFAANAQNVQHLSLPQPGGMPGLPVVTGVARASNGVSITWDGPSGYYQLFQKESLTNSKWQAVGKDTNLIRQATVKTTLPASSFESPARRPNTRDRRPARNAIRPSSTRVAHTAHAGAFTNAAFAAQRGPNQRLLPAVPHRWLWLAHRIQSAWPKLPSWRACNARIATGRPPITPPIPMIQPWFPASKSRPRCAAAAMPSGLRNGKPATTTPGDLQSQRHNAD